MKQVIFVKASALLAKTRKQGKDDPLVDGCIPRNESRANTDRRGEPRVRPLDDERMNKGEHAVRPYLTPSNRAITVRYQETKEAL